jgi:hypothetical protein
VEVNAGFSPMQRHLGITGIEHGVSLRLKHASRNDSNVMLIIDDQNGLHVSRDLHWSCDSKSEATANSAAKWKSIHSFSALACSRNRDSDDF